MSVVDGLSNLSRLMYRGTTLGLSKGPRISRYTMYQRLAQFSRLSRPEHVVLSVSRSLPLARLLGYRQEQVIEADYPQYDLLNLSFESYSLDVLIADQVLEHIAGDPARAVSESFRVLRPGGMIFLTTCFVNPIHEFPHDYWRFSPEGLRVLMPPDANVLECSGWGNRVVWLFDLFRIRYEGIPHARWHPAHWAATYNNQRWPVSTWIVAQKMMQEQFER